MKTVGVDSNISVTDDVRFILETRDGEDCLITPYKIGSVVVYFVSREFTDSTATQYDKQMDRPDLVAEYESVKKELCLKAKAAVLAATTSNIVLSGLQTVDGISLSEGDRVLVKNQSVASQNGIYLASAGDWARSSDADEDDKVVKGAYVFVEEGIQNISTGWVLVSSDPISLDATALSFLKFSENGSPSSPDDNSLERLKMLKKQIEESRKTSSFFYKDAIPVKVFGGYTDPETGELFPAWLNPMMVPSELKDKTMADNILYEYEEDGGVQSGKFVLEWQPLDMREGDYFVCWNWTPNMAGESLSAHMYFSLEANGALTASIPTHVADPRKYEMLLERYTPEMFKSILSENDLTPMVMKGLNGSVGAGFTLVENLANQIIDLLDANATHEQLLPLLSNLFNLRLKSSDPTLWRRQIKKAVPNFKRKGSIAGLRSALGDIGMKFQKMTRLWQVVSKYTYQEHFVYEGYSTFSLSRKMVLPADVNFGLWYRPVDGEWEDLTGDYAAYVETHEDTIDWIGPELNEGDSIRILYRTRNVPAGSQDTENYIRSLPLLDDRDERDQQYPPKNWNVRALEEDDPMFDVIIPTRHPLADPIIWGRIRTEFPYSENAYNMDEYNGSKRDSMDPCDIDKEFVDPCGNCQSSSFNLDIEVEKLSDDSFNEARQVVEEYMPFHSRVHTFNLSGAINEFVRPSSENIDMLVSYSREDVLIAGDGQKIFHRNVDSSDLDSVRRDLLASYTAISNGSSTTWSGTIRNEGISLLSSTISDESDISDPDFKGKTQGFESLNINTSQLDSDPFLSGNLLEVLGTTTKNYTLSSVTGNSARLYDPSGVDVSLIGPLFEYRVSNRIADFNVDIEQADQVIFEDEDADFHMLGIITQYDVDFNSVAGSVWRLRVSDKEYSVQNILPDGTLLLKEESSIAPVSGWELVRDNVVQKSSASASSPETYHYGLVTVNSISGDVRDALRIGDYVYMGWPSSTRSYRIKSFKSGQDDQFYVQGYNEGSVGGENIKVYRRVLDGKVGQLGYEGLALDAADNLEDVASISNGDNYDPSDLNSHNVKENFLLFIDGKYYTISEINGSNVVLGGPMDSFTIDGQAVDFMVYKFTKENLDLADKVVPPYTEHPPRYQFDGIDRRGGSILTNTDGHNRVVLMSSVLNAANANQPVDVIGQTEAIDFQIEYKEEK